MILSQIGIVADVLWHEIKNHAPNVELDAFIVMPNHIHGIIILKDNNATQEKDIKSNEESNKNEGENEDREKEEEEKEEREKEEGEKVRATHALPQQGKNTLSSILGSYKSAVSKHVHRLGFEFSWQRNYYEHIIRNKQSYQNISNYIINNPAKWAEDKFSKD